MRNCSVKNTEERILVIKERKMSHKPFRILIVALSWRYPHRLRSDRRGKGRVLYCLSY
jgi:hypothetical protein